MHLWGARTYQYTNGIAIAKGSYRPLCVNATERPVALEWHHEIRGHALLHLGDVPSPVGVNRLGLRGRGEFKEEHRLSFKIYTDAEIPGRYRNSKYMPTTLHSKIHRK